MDQEKTIRVPWKNWDSFSRWAQDFSLKQKVLGAFLGVAVFVGLLTLILGMRLARYTIIEEAMKKVSSDLSTAVFIVNSYKENLELKVRMIGRSDRIKDYINAGDFALIRNRLAMMNLENDLDFLAIINPSGNLIAQAYQLEPKNEDLAGVPVVKAALTGKSASGFRITEIKLRDNPTLAQRFGANLPRTGLTLEAAYPIFQDSKVVGVVYGGMLINNNHLFVERIAQRLFKDQAHTTQKPGFVAIFQGDEAISSSVKGSDKLPITGFLMNKNLKDNVLNNGEIVIKPEREFNN
ncbi:MAG: hypothetical protein ACP5VS_09280, partial [Desulfomonilaceae bacterium]